MVEDWGVQLIRPLLIQMSGNHSLKKHKTSDFSGKAPHLAETGSCHVVEAGGP
jgi:hypothetical protein